MKELSAVFPAAVILFVLLLASEYVRSEGLPRPERPVRPRDHRMHPGDHALAWALAAVYALAAFTGLGSRSAPESECRSTGGEALYFTLEDEKSLGMLRWYAALGTGSWLLESSEDGAVWTQELRLDQNYISLFKWNESSLEEGVAAAYYRLRPDSGSPGLGELALYAPDGERLYPVTCTANASALFDEGELVPEGQSYLNSSYFDEIYHPRTALEGLRGESLYEITHPPLGKLILSLGIALWGMTPFGWRFMGTLSGVLMLPILYAFLKRLFGRREIAAGGTLIFAADFMHYTQTRLATIDSYSVLFILLMYYFMYRFADGRDEHPLRSLALSGLFFGMGAASKWTCLYAGAGLGVIWLLYWVFRKEIFRRPFWKNVGHCLLFFVAVPLLIYYLSYWPYGRAAGLSWPGMYFSGDYAALVWDNQLYMWNYHSALVATHPYSSQWWQWVLDIRPILYYLEYFDDGSKSAIAAFTNPLLCWGGLAALAGCARAAWQRDKKALFILLGYLAQLLPWVLVTRLTFAYHYFPSEVFLVLALGFAFDGIETKSGRLWPLVSFAAVALLLFAAFYPVLSGVPVSRDYCSNFLQWFGSWPI